MENGGQSIDIYLANVRSNLNDSIAWQELIRAHTALAVAGGPDALDRHLAQLREQDESLFESVVSAVLDRIELSRPEDFYLLAERAHDCAPDCLSLRWYWSCAMNFVARKSPREALLHTREWARRFTDSLPKARYVRDQTPIGSRRFRVGYVAAKLHLMFLSNHMMHHDFDKFDILVFTNDQRCLPGSFPPKVSVLPLGTGDPTELLREARLDLAIEMMGISYRARWRGIEGIAAFAKRIAPVQCHWIITTSTYGMESAFDFILADENLIPQSLEGLYVEKVRRLPKVAHCWIGNQSRGGLTRSPFSVNGFITFGSANRGTKITIDVLKLWSRVVAAVPGSKMIIKGLHVDDPLFKERALEAFQEQGVRDSLFFSRATRFPKFPADFYGQIDISLDTYPYGGAITTLESLWNGVPVVTLRGDSFVSRVAADYLEVIGRGCWVAESENAYVEIATSLAADRDRLVEERATLQEKLASSPLMDGRSFSRDLENACLEMYEDVIKREQRM